MADYRNHLKIGNAVIQHKNKNVVSTIGSDSLTQFVRDMDSFDFNVGYIPPGYEHRADLISYLFYDTPTFDWLICWFNGVDDPFQQLNIMDEIKIPKLV